MQSQACQQVMDEAEKEYKKISGRINEGREAMKVDIQFVVNLVKTESDLPTSTSHMLF